MLDVSLGRGDEKFASFCSQIHAFPWQSYIFGYLLHKTAFFSLFSLQYDQQTHHSEQHTLRPGVLAQQDGNVPDERNVPNHAANHLLLPVQVELIARVELGVVGMVVVTLCEEVQGSSPALPSAFLLSAGEHTLGGGGGVVVVGTHFPL